MRHLFVWVLLLGSLTTVRGATLNYHTYDDLISALNQLAQDHPSIAKTVELTPETEESRSLTAIKISDNVDDDEDENRVLFTGAHHAREWISVEVPYLLAKHLVDGYGTDPTITQMVDHEEIWIIPVVNPDGYTYSHTEGHRLWRKNRRRNGFFCTLFDRGWGVDLNRNYGSSTWGITEDGASSGSCYEQTYHGPEAFSEPETQAIRDLMKEYSFDAVLSYHSYQQLILYPWGHTKDPVPDTGDHQLMKNMADQMEQVIEAVPGAADYVPQQSSELYTTTGDVTDWVYETHKIPAFTVELRPSKEDWEIGFKLPAEEIQPTWEENRPAALYLIDAFNLKVASPRGTKPATAGPAGKPTKIRVTALGLPRGMAPSDFQVDIGGLPADVIAATRLPEVTGGRVQLGYELQIQPPIQQANGTYDLEVVVGDAAVVVPEAIVYKDTSNVDVVLVIDRSGSMGGEKIEDAKTAAKQFVDLMVTGDMVGVVSFSSSAVVDYGLTTIEGTVKDDVRAAIDQIYSGGGTSIGSGLALAHGELTTKGDATHPWVAVLLSDGMSSYPDTVLEDLRSAGIPVYSIGLGSGADEVLLQDIASYTGGSYYYAPSSQELADIYASISASVSGQQTLLATESAVQQDGTDVQHVVVDSTVSEVTFAINWPGSDLDLTLNAPSGSVIDPDRAAADSDIDYVSGSTFEYYRVQAPEQGDWVLTTFGKSVTGDEELYSVRVDARSELSMDLWLHGEARVGNPLRLAVSLADTRPITGSNVWVEVVPPTITPTVTVDLYDDGQHDDGSADDGIYANRFDQLDQEGPFQFLGYAAGATSEGEPFTRQTYRTLPVQADPEQTVHVTAPSDFFVEPGTTATAVFTVTNAGSEYATYKLLAGPVEVSQWARLSALPDTISLYAGSSEQVSIPLDVPPLEEQPSVNLLTLKAIDQMVPEVSAKDAVTITTDVPRADLMATVEGPTVAAPGTEQDFLVMVANNGPAEATDVFLSWEVESGMEIVSDSLGNREAISDTVGMWYLPPLPGGSSTDVTVRVLMPGERSAGRVYRVSAGTASGYTAAGPTVGVQDPDLVNNQAALDVLVKYNRIYLPLASRSP